MHAKCLISVAGIAKDCTLPRPYIGRRYRLRVHAFVWVGKCTKLHTRCKLTFWEAPPLLSIRLGEAVKNSQLVGQGLAIEMVVYHVNDLASLFGHTDHRPPHGLSLMITTDRFSGRAGPLLGLHAIMSVSGWAFVW